MLANPALGRVCLGVEIKRREGIKYEIENNNNINE